MDNLDISNSIALLKSHEENYRGNLNKSIIKDHTLRLINGLQFLEKLLNLSTNEYLKEGIKHLVAGMSEHLGSLPNNLELAYVELRGNIKCVILNQGTDDYGTIFPGHLLWIGNFKRTNDFLLDNIKKLITYSNDKTDQSMNKLKELEKMLTYLKPLFTYVAAFKMSYIKNEDRRLLFPLVAVLDKAACIIYALLVGTIDEHADYWLKMMFSKLLDKTDVIKIYHEALRTLGSGKSESLLDTSGNELCLLDNLIKLLQINAKNFEEIGSKLLEELVRLRSFLGYLEENVRLKKLHFMKASIQAIFYEAIHILYSCFVEEIEEGAATKIDGMLSNALELIKRMKSEIEEIKLYFYPKIDCLGFLKSFSIYLLELLEQEKLSALKNEVEVLLEVCSLLAFNDLIQEKLNTSPWADMLDWAYQAHYVIDLYLVNPNNLSIVLTFFNIIEKVKLDREKLIMDHFVEGSEKKDAITMAKLPSRLLSGEALQAQEAATMSGRIPVMPTQASGVMVGYEEDSSIILGYLINDEKKLNRIVIVGMAGMGKTTLAMSLYNNPSVHRHFETRVWCTVSQNYKKSELVLKISDQLSAHAGDVGHNDEQDLADALHRKLRQKRYLIVFDDVWDIDIWNYLIRYLPDDQQGSRILVTTRMNVVASGTNAKVHFLNGLGQKMSLELLKTKLPQGGRLSDNLLSIANSIVKSCNGLPLAIVVIAGLLSTLGENEHKWNALADRLTSLTQRDYLVILNLSYSHLPSHLQSCFLYLGVFPEDRDIQVSHLVRLWIGEGLVGDIGSKSSEDVAEQYIKNLLSRNLVISGTETSLGGIKTFRLHDLLRDFCLEKAKSEHFLRVLDKRNYSSPQHDPTRLSINCSIADFKFSCHSIRSVIFFEEVDATEIDCRIESYDMVLLKVLDIRELLLTPSCISRLIHLRYLAIWKMYEESSILLSTITKLQNLQILIFESCSEPLVEVPDSIWDMIKLRHVHIRPSASFHVDRTRLDNSPFLLKDVKSLSRPRLSDVDMKFLEKLPELQKLNCIFFPSWSDSLEYHTFGLSFHGSLTSLKVEYGPEMMKRCKFYLPLSLKKLNLSGFILTSKDISDMGTLPNLQVLKLNICGQWDSEGIVEWRVTEEEFPELKVLKLRILGFHQWTASEDSFYRLEQLWLEDCNFDEIPLEFGCLPNLRLLSVTNCKPSVDYSASTIETAQQEVQNMDFRVVIIPKKVKASILSDS